MPSVSLKAIIWPKVSIRLNEKRRNSGDVSVRHISWRECNLTSTRIQVWAISHRNLGQVSGWVTRWALPCFGRAWYFHSQVRASSFSSASQWLLKLVSFLCLLNDHLYGTSVCLSDSVGNCVHYTPCPHQQHCNKFSRSQWPTVSLPPASYVTQFHKSLTSTPALFSGDIIGAMHTQYKRSHEPFEKN